MHAYVGERVEGRTTVWVVEQPERPEVSEVVQVLSELNRLTDDPERRSFEQSDEYRQRRADYLAQKDDLVARIRAAEAAPLPVALVHQWTGSQELFDWANRGAGATALARSVLTRELAQRVPVAVFRRFRDEVVAGLPASTFELKAAEVWGWIAGNRELVDHELFLAPPSLVPAAPTLVAEEGDANELAAERPDAATASALVRACEEAWADIRAHHPDLPDAVMILGSGVERGRLVKLGHWWGGRWLADGDVRGEVLLAGEALHLPPAQVFEVLLHEAAHGLNAARGVKDTSRGGRYHNQRFATSARDVLLDVKAMPPYGLASTSLSAAGEERYADTVERLGEAMRIVRQLERSAGVGEGTGVEGSIGESGGGTEAEGNDGRSRGAVASSCGCGRRMRMAPSVLAAGPVLCGMCGAEFNPVARRSRGAEASSDAAVDRSFLARLGIGPHGRTKDGARPHPALAAEMERRRDPIDAALLRAGTADDPKVRPLRRRQERLDALVGDEGVVRSSTPDATPDQVLGLRELGALNTNEADTAPWPSGTSASAPTRSSPWLRRGRRRSEAGRPWPAAC